MLVHCQVVTSEESQQIKSLLCPIYYCRHVGPSGQELPSHQVHTVPTGEKWLGVCMVFPEVHQPLCLSGVQDQVVVTDPLINL